MFPVPALCRGPAALLVSVTAVGPSLVRVRLLLGPWDSLGIRVPQGGGIAPLQVHVERLVLTMRLFSSAQDLARSGDLSEGAVSLGPLGGVHPGQSQQQRLDLQAAALRL